jgi:hypothetical protein
MPIDSTDYLEPRCEALVENKPRAGLGSTRSVIYAHLQAHTGVAVKTSRGVPIDFLGQLLQGWRNGHRVRWVHSELP